MSDNNIYEIAQMMQNKKVIRNDINEAFSLIATMFQDRYINKIRNAVEEKQIEIKNNPSKEINLLYSLKPFFNKEQQEPIDKTIDTICMIQTLQKLTGQANIKTVNTKIDSSIHEDGIYDIDDNCIFNTDNSSNGLLNVMLLLAVTSTKVNQIN